VTHQQVDGSTCTQMLAVYRSQAQKLSPTDQAALAKLTPLDCEWVGTLRVQASGPSAGSPLADVRASSGQMNHILASPTACAVYDGSLAFVAGPITGFTLRVRVSMCNNGSIAWTNWGPDCYIYQILPMYYTNTTWCGVWHSGYWETNPGMNTSFAPSITPWWTLAYPWMRYRVYGNGSTSAIWGGK
jgi:hypothetical protein